MTKIEAAKGNPPGFFSKKIESLENVFSGNNILTLFELFSRVSRRIISSTEV